MDTEMDGMATGLSTTITRDGQSTATARIPFAAGLSAAAGTTASVAYAQTNDTNTGMYFPATDQWGLVAGGTAVAVGTATGVAITGTFSASGAATLSDALALTGNLAVNTNKFTVTAASGNTLVAGTFDVTGNFAINTNKFNVTAASGNTAIAGTLGVTGDVAVNTNKMTVAAASGNTAIAGTLGVTGDVSVNTNKLTVAASSGNTAIAGTLAVTGASTFTGVITGRIGLLHVRDEKTSGTDGGAFTSGAWQTRTLITEVTNEITGASLGSNQITLPAGTYVIDAHAPAFGVGDSKLRLRNITDGADLLVGATFSDQASTGGVCLIKGRFTLAGTKALELQHRCTSSRVTNGLGRSTSFGVTEVYADAMIQKVA